MSKWNLYDGRKKFYSFLSVICHLFLLLSRISVGYVGADRVTDGILSATNLSPKCLNAKILQTCWNGIMSETA